MRADTPSRTARKVALSVVTLGAEPAMAAILPPGLVESTAELLVASGAVGARTVRLARSPRMLSVYRAFDWMLPGQFEAFAYRKAFCERQVRDGIAAGATQVLVLGAGYDTLGWRLAPEHPEVRFYEIDHPATARLKARGVERMGPRENLTLVAEDLGATELPRVLAAEGTWDPGGRSVIVAEGLVMYLSAGAVADLFRRCGAVTGEGSRIAWSFIPSGDDGRPDVGRWTGLMLWLQRLIGEPWTWSLRPEALGEFLSASGWREATELGERHGVELFVVAVK